MSTLQIFNDKFVETPTPLASSLKDEINEHLEQVRQLKIVREREEKNGGTQERINEIVERINDEDAVLIEKKAEFEAEMRYNLFDSAKYGFVDNIKKVIKDHRVDPNLKDPLGWTALHWACCRGKLDIVKALIGYGAGVNEKNTTGKTPLHLAAFNGYEIPVTYPKIVRFLIEKGADVNAPDEEKRTPLMYARDNGHDFMAKLLISKGALEDE